MKRFEMHSHTEFSNMTNRDSTNFVTKLIEEAIRKDLSGICITDHGNLSAHVDAILHMKELRKEIKENCEKDPQNVLLLEEREKLNNFKLGLGTEIYLVDRDEINKAKENYLPTKFYHLIVIAKNYKGYRALAKLSSNSWDESFFYRGMQRIPTYKDYFFNWLEENKGNVIVTTACLGGEFAQLSLGFLENQNQENRTKIINFLSDFKNIIGDDFYIEIQPSFISEEQIAFNKLAVQIAEALGIKVVINTDAHYLSADKKEIHSIYLKSQNAERETEQFYSSTYLMDYEELRSYFNYISIDKFNEYINNSIEARDRIEEYDLAQETDVPRTRIKWVEDRMSILAPIVMKDKNKYKYIYKFGTSENEVDKALLQQIELGILEKNIIVNDESLLRINKELRSLWKISEKLKKRLSNYYLLTKEIVNIMWRISLVGVSRGSAGAFYICYLLGITSINPLKYDLPDWRHISPERPELPDIDIDTEAGQRDAILELIKEEFGEDKVLNICTFKTEGTASAIQTICRGMNIPTEEASYISSLVVDGMSVKECLEEFDTNKEAALLIKEMMNYEGLIENVIEIEGLVCGRSSHASGVYIFNKPYWESNAMMKTPKGLPVTQYDMKNSDYQGGVKLDFLTIESLDRIRKDMEMLIKDNLIEDQGSLKKTHDKYIHPDVLNFEDKKMWDMFSQNKILDAFQYDSVQGKNAIATINPRTFREAMYGNALMRLICEGILPIDKFAAHKKDINIWYNEMKDAGLNGEEVKVMEEHLLKSYGVACTQEDAMRLSMDKRIAGFSLKEANKLRKAIAKSYAKDTIDPIYQKWVKNGVKLGNREFFVKYVWKTHIEPMLGYSFSDPHIAGYTMILLQEMNLARISDLHWKTACLCINSGDINENKTKGTDYGAVAKAIAGMENGLILPPSINNADISFKPDMEKDKIYYGLGAINGISIDLAREMIKARPFYSFDDFLEKCVKTKVVQPSKVYNLIKGGCFDEFCKDRVKVAQYFVSLQSPDKEKLTMANVNRLAALGLLNKSLEKQYILTLFKKAVFCKENCDHMINKTQGVYLVKDLDKKYNIDLVEVFEEAITYNEEGELCLKSKEFNKIYKRETKQLEDTVKSKEILDKYNLYEKILLFNKYMSGTIAKWEMDSLGYYTTHHELEDYNLGEYFDIKTFDELPEQPEYYYEQNKVTRKTYKKFKTDMIAGVVVDKNKNKKMITLSTEFGVVDVKMSKEMFTTYDKATDEEKSWFKRGTKIIVIGYRKGQSFRPKVYKNDKFDSAFIKVDKSDTGNIIFRYSRDEFGFDDLLA